MTPVRPNEYLRASAAIIALGIAAAPAAAQQVSAGDIDRMMAVIEAQQAQIDAMRAELNALKSERTAAAAPAPAHASGGRAACDRGRRRSGARERGRSNGSSDGRGGVHLEWTRAAGR